MLCCRCKWERTRQEGASLRCEEMSLVGQEQCVNQGRLVSGSWIGDRNEQCESKRTIKLKAVERKLLEVIRSVMV